MGALPVMVGVLAVFLALAVLWELANRGWIGRRATKRGLMVVAWVVFVGWVSWHVAGLMALIR